MPAPTVAVSAPADGSHLFDPGILRPHSLVRWSGGVGPFDVVHEWDTDPLFSAPLTDTNAAATSEDEGVPPADLGPAGTPWYYRARVIDTSDAAEATTATVTLEWENPRNYDRHLYALANVGVGFTPTDDPAAGWGPAPAAIGPDGDPTEFDRYLYLLANVGVGFTPTDDPAAGWGPAPAAIGPDGDPTEFDRYLYLLANVGVGFTPTDDPAAGWDPESTGDPLIGPGDGAAIEFDRYLYLLANVTADTPTPHIWYLYPNFGRQGWEFVIVGYGFGDTQATFAGSATLNGLALGVGAWAGFAETSPDLTIDPIANIAEPVHQEIRTSVPAGASSGLVIVCTDGP